MHTRGRRPGAGGAYAYACWLLAPFVLAAATGCQEYNWRIDHVQAEQDARERGKDLFVFYKHWLDRNSNDMFNIELSDPAVKALFQNTINVRLEKGFPAWDEYAAKYGVNSCPASIIVRPDGTFKVQSGRISKEQFIEWVKEAKSRPPREPGKTKTFMS